MRHTNLTKIHDDALVNLLPQVGPKDLNEGDLQCGDLSVHEDSSQIKLHLETHVDLNRRRNDIHLHVFPSSSSIIHLRRDT